MVCRSGILVRTGAKCAVTTKHIEHSLSCEDKNGPNLLLVNVDTHHANFPVV
jgi:hypothetical protein